MTFYLLSLTDFYIAQPKAELCYHEEEKENH